MSANKITVAIPENIVGMVKVSGMIVTIAKGRRFAPDIQNWLGQVTRQCPDVEVVEATLSELMAEDQNEDTKALIMRRRSVDVSTDGGGMSSSNLVKEAISIFSWAAQAKASDIYFDVNEQGGVGTLSRKVNGLIDPEKMEMRSQDAEAILSTVYMVMGDGKEKGNWSKKEPAYASIRKPGFLPDGIHSIRIQTNVSDIGYGATLRLLEKKKGDQETSRLAALGYSQDLIKSMNMLLMRPKGGMLIVGGVGSGKSTTLQALLEILNQWHSGQKRIYTVEDPVEYPINCAIQMGVTGTSAGMSSDEQYAEAVKILLRSAPDIGMVGEIRGRGTAAEFFRIASSGFKGLSTIHGNGCWAGIKRLHEELRVPISYLSDLSIFNGCVTQQLLQTLCPGCKIPLDEAINKNIDGMKEKAYSLRKQLDSAFSADMSNEPHFFLHRKGGCPTCDSRGYNGRTVIAEAVICDTMMWEEFAKAGGANGSGWSAAEDYWQTKQEGRTLLDNALTKIAAGIVDPLTTMREVGALNMTAALKDHSLSRTEIADAVSVFITDPQSDSKANRPVLAYSGIGK